MRQEAEELEEAVGEVVLGHRQEQVAWRECPVVVLGSLGQLESGQARAGQAERRGEIIYLFI